MSSSAAEQPPADQNRTMVLGWDCSRPTAIDTFERSSFCSLGRPTPKPGHPTAEYAIAQLKPAECDRIVRRGVYKTVQGRVITGIGTPGYTTTQFNARGWDGIRNGDAACLGVKTFKKDSGEEIER